MHGPQWPRKSTDYTWRRAVPVHKGSNSHSRFSGPLLRESITVLNAEESGAHSGHREVAEGGGQGLAVGRCASHFWVLDSKV